MRLRVGYRLPACAGAPGPAGMADPPLGWRSPPEHWRPRPPMAPVDPGDAAQRSPKAGARRSPKRPGRGRRGRGAGAVKVAAAEASRAMRGQRWRRQRRRRSVLPCADPGACAAAASRRARARARALHCGATTRPSVNRAGRGRVGETARFPSDSSPGRADSPHPAQSPASIQLVVEPSRTPDRGALRRPSRDRPRLGWPGRSRRRFRPCESARWQAAAPERGQRNAPRGSL